MKKRSLLMGMVLAVCGLVSLTGCVEGDDWPYSPPPGWGSDYFYDSRLDGVWMLTQANSTPVDRYDTNYLDFYGRGHGWYYYYDNGRPESEELAYFCQRSYSATTNYQINLQYESGSASTMAYWFSDGDTSPWLQWQPNTGRIATPLYPRVGATPW